MQDNWVVSELFLSPAYPASNSKINNNSKCTEYDNIPLVSVLMRKQDFEIIHSKFQTEHDHTERLRPW